MTRCDRLRSSLKEGEGVIVSGYPNIFYYSGFTSSDAVLFITKHRQVLVTDSRYMLQARQEAKDFEIRDITDGLQKIADGLDCLSFGYEENYVTVNELKSFQKFSKELVPMQQTISKQRYTKDEAEIKKIAASEELAVAAFNDTLKKIRAGMTEREVALMLEFYMRREGAQKSSFETIVASGLRSAMPHGVATDKVLGIGDFVTMDFGCVLDGYCSDMTRTVVLGKCSPRQKEIYDVVLNAQNAAISAMTVGKKCADIDKVARDIITDAGYGKNFGHSLGHSVGIEIHESPNLSPKSEDVLKTGNVVTVEPGIYIEGFGGVRIEDVVVIDEKVQNLTDCSKDLIII